MEEEALSGTAGGAPAAPELYRQAGLADVGAECVTPLHPAGHSRRTIRLDLVRGMRPVIVRHGIADEAELDELDHAVREHLADPDTLVMPFMYVMAWGRKPGAGDQRGGVSPGEIGEPGGPGN